MKIMRQLNQGKTEYWLLQMTDVELLELVFEHKDIKEAFREYLRIVP